MWSKIKLLVVSLSMLSIYSNVYAQDLLKSKNCKTTGHWEISANGLKFKPLGNQEESGGLYSLSPLPENFTIDFEWIEKTKDKDVEPAGGLSFKYGDFGQFGESLDCYFSGYLIKIHTKNPTEKIINGSQNGVISSSVLLNFLNPPGKLNKGRIICHEQKIQVLINHNLVYDLDLSEIFKAQMGGIDLSQDVIKGFKNWSEAKKRGLYTSITLAESPKNSDFAVVEKFLISDHKNNPMEKPLIDSTSGKETLWCKSGNLDPEKTKIYGELSHFLQKTGYRNGISNEDDLLEPFTGFKSPLISNNQLLVRVYTRGLFDQGAEGSLKVESYLIANIKDKCNSSVKVFQFGSQDDAKKAFDICKTALKNEDGKLLTCKINGNFLLLCLMLNDNPGLDANAHYKDINSYFLKLKP